MWREVCETHTCRRQRHSASFRQSGATTEPKQASRRGVKAKPHTKEEENGARLGLQEQPPVSGAVSLRAVVGPARWQPPKDVPLPGLSRLVWLVPAAGPAACLRLYPSHGFAARPSIPSWMVFRLTAPIAWLGAAFPGTRLLGLSFSSWSCAGVTLLPRCFVPPSRGGTCLSGAVPYVPNCHRDFDASSLGCPGEGPCTPLAFRLWLGCSSLSLCGRSNAGPWSFLLPAPIAGYISQRRLANAAALFSFAPALPLDDSCPCHLPLRSSRLIPHILCAVLIFSMCVARRPQRALPSRKHFGRVDVR